MAQFPTDPSPDQHALQHQADELRTPQEKQRVFLGWAVAIVAAIVFALIFPQATKTILVFIATLSVLVFVHEWGHYQFGRWAGMKVNRFAIGFPPFIYTKRHKGIDYSIGALPIGGMVDISGLGSEEEMVATAKGQPLDVAASNPTKPHGEKNFQDASLIWRFWTLFAGPLMNFVYALIVFIGIYSLVGVPKSIARIETVNPGEPAARAGLRAGDRIVGIGGLKTENPDVISSTIQNKKGAPISVRVQRNGAFHTYTLKPILKDDEEHPGKKAYYIGIRFDGTNSLEYDKVDVATAVKTGFSESVETTVQILGVVKRAVTGQLSKEEAKGIGGPVKIAQATGFFAEKGFIASLYFSAMLSVNLGLMNLLPFPALDGGRILFLGYELVARRPVNARIEGITHTVGMVMLLAFMLFITMRDIWPYITKTLQLT